MIAVLYVLLGWFVSPSACLPFCVDRGGCLHFEQLRPKPVDGRNRNRSDISFPLIGLGTAALRDQTSSLVAEAVRQYGYGLIDTAQASEWYDEEGVGEGLFVLTAAGFDVDPVVVVTKIHPRSYSPDVMETKVRESIYLLYKGRKQSLDVVLLHSPRCWSGHCTPEQDRYRWQDAWVNLEGLYDIGLVSSIGVSNFSPRELNELLRIATKPVAVVQNWMDPFHQDPEVRRICEAHDIVYMAYSSLGTQWPTEKDAFGYHANPVLSHPSIVDIASKHSVTAVDVVLSWVLQEGAVALPRASRGDHMASNMRLLQPSTADQSTQCRTDAKKDDSGGSEGITGVCSAGERGGGASVFLDRDDITRIRQLHGTRTR